MQTTRRAIAEGLRETPATPSTIAAEHDVSVGTALEHVEHLAASLRSTDERVAVRPPACTDCGFDGFDDLLNIPSRCPECRSEAVAEPVVRVE